MCAAQRTALAERRLLRALTAQSDGLRRDTNVPRAGRSAGLRALSALMLLAYAALLQHQLSAHDFDDGSTFERTRLLRESHDGSPRGHACAHDDTSEARELCAASAVRSTNIAPTSTTQLVFTRQPLGAAQRAREARCPLVMLTLAPKGSPPRA